jgi:hypothetical protein
LLPIPSFVQFLCCPSLHIASLSEMIETMHTGTPYVELRTGAPHASVLVCVFAPFTTLQGGRGPAQNEK